MKRLECTPTTYFFVTTLVLKELFRVVAVDEAVGEGDMSQEAEESQCIQGKV